MKKFIFMFFLLVSVLSFGEDECRSTRDCSWGRECVHGYCRDIQDDQCRSDYDCSWGRECVWGRCQNVHDDQCNSDRDCSAGRYCRNGKCQYYRDFFSLILKPSSK